MDCQNGMDGFLMAYKSTVLQAGVSSVSTVRLTELDGMPIKIE